MLCAIKMLMLSVWYVAIIGVVVVVVDGKLCGKIVNGHSAAVAQYPYQLSLQFFEQHICGAALISPLWAVTAAHCTKNFPAWSLTCRGGSIFPYKGIVAEVESINLPPEFNTTADYHYDVSLLRFKAPIKFSETLQPVKLPDNNFVPQAGTDGFCTGFGMEAAKGCLPESLQVVSLTIIDKFSCAQQYVNYSLITRTMFCTLVQNRDACQGDSGGPFVQNNTLIGIVSWGRGCARSDSPGVFTDVAKVRNYIRNVTGI